MARNIVLLHGKRLRSLQLLTSSRALQDSTWHHGWVFHAAPPNDGPRDRLALAISYVSAAAHVLDNQDEEGLRRRPDDEDRESYSDWIGAVEGGAVADHKMLPIVYPPLRAS